MASLKRLMCCSLILATEAILCSGSIARDQTPDVKPKPTGSISGRVTVGGSAAEGIPVVAVFGQTVNRRDAAARSVTDSEGRYRLTELLPGQYQIWALTPGLIAEPGPLPRDGFPHFGSIRNIILSAYENVSDVDIKLVRGAVITGRVTDAENKPVAEERVFLQLVDEKGAPSRIGSAVSSSHDQMYRTDDRGIYRIYGLSGGRYKVSVGYDPGDGVVRGQYPRTFHPDVSDQSKGAVVELNEGGEAKNIDIKVGSATKTYSVSGQVTDGETGLPIPRAGLRFMVVRQDKGPPAPSWGVQADDRGEFIFDGLVSGQYTAVATSEFYGGNFYSDPVNFEVVDQNVRGLELKAIPGLSVSGMVVGDGVMTKDLLALLPGLRIFARMASGASRDVLSGGSSIVAPDGSFQVNGLRPGRVSIDAFVSAPYTRPSIARIEHDGIGVTQGFDIQQSVSGLRIIINYGTGAIRGTVRLEGGGSLADSRIFVNSKRQGEREGTRIVVDARGHFVIKNLAPGTYEVTVQAGFDGAAAPYRRPPPQKQLVNVTNGSETEVTFVVDLTPKQGGP